MFVYSGGFHYFWTGQNLWALTVNTPVLLAEYAALCLGWLSFLNRIMLMSLILQIRKHNRIKTSGIKSDGFLCEN